MDTLIATVMLIVSGFLAVNARDLHGVNKREMIVDAIASLLFFLVSIWIIFWS